MLNMSKYWIYLSPVKFTVTLKLVLVFVFALFHI
jgi:hypothetical protein